MRRVKRSQMNRRVGVESSLKRLGAAVAKDLLIREGVPIEEDWKFSECLRFITENKKHYDHLDRFFNSHLEKKDA